MAAEHPSFERALEGIGLAERKIFLRAIREKQYPSAEHIAAFLEIIEDNPELAYRSADLVDPKQFIRFIDIAGLEGAVVGDDAVVNFARSGLHMKALSEWCEDEYTPYDELNWTIVADGIERVARAHGWDGAVHHPQARIKHESPYFRALIALDESTAEAGADRLSRHAEIRRAAVPVIERFISNHPDFGYVDQLLTLGAMLDSSLRERRDDVPEWTEENLVSLTFNTRKIIRELDNLSTQLDDRRDVLALLAFMYSWIRAQRPSPDLFLCLVIMVALPEADQETVRLFAALGASTGFRSWHDRVFGTTYEEKDPYPG